jgi:hypothetical protein
LKNPNFKKNYKNKMKYHTTYRCEATSKTIEEKSNTLTFILIAYIRKKTIEIIAKAEAIEINEIYKGYVKGTR